MPKTYSGIGTFLDSVCSVKKKIVSSLYNICTIQNNHYLKKKKKNIYVPNFCFIAENEVVEPNCAQLAEYCSSWLDFIKKQREGNT